MQIPKELPQYTDIYGLVLVLGGLEGAGYFCNSGTIEPVFTYEQPTPSYSDKEGFFQESGNGQTFGTGSVREDDVGEQHKRFAIAIAERVAAVDTATPLSCIDLCAPQHLLSGIESHLPAQLRSKIRVRIDAQLTKVHVTDVLARIADALERQGE